MRTARHLFVAGLIAVASLGTGCGSAPDTVDDGDEQDLSLPQSQELLKYLETVMASGTIDEPGEDVAKPALSRLERAVGPQNLTQLMTATGQGLGESESQVIRVTRPDKKTALLSFKSYATKDGGSTLGLVNVEDANGAVQTFAERDVVQAQKVVSTLFTIDKKGVTRVDNLVHTKTSPLPTTGQALPAGGRTSHRDRWLRQPGHVQHVQDRRSRHQALAAHAGVLDHPPHLQRGLRGSWHRGRRGYGHRRGSHRRGRGRGSCSGSWRVSRMQARHGRHFRLDSRQRDDARFQRRVGKNGVLQQGRGLRSRWNCVVRRPRAGVLRPFRAPRFHNNSRRSVRRRRTMRARLEMPGSAALLRGHFPRHLGFRYSVACDVREDRCRCLRWVDPKRRRPSDGLSRSHAEVRVTILSARRAHGPLRVRARGCARGHGRGVRGA